MDLNLRQEWADWIDRFVKENPHGLKSRAAVVEFALERLRQVHENEVDPRQVAMLFEELESRLEALRKRPAGSPRSVR